MCPRSIRPIGLIAKVRPLADIVKDGVLTDSSGSYSGSAVFQVPCGDGSGAASCPGTRYDLRSSGMIDRRKGLAAVLSANQLSGVTKMKNTDRSDHLLC